MVSDDKPSDFRGQTRSKEIFSKHRIDVQISSLVLHSESMVTYPITGLFRKRNNVIGSPDKGIEPWSNCAMSLPWNIRVVGKPINRRGRRRIEWRPPLRLGIYGRR